MVQVGPSNHLINHWKLQQCNDCNVTTSLVWILDFALQCYLSRPVEKLHCTKLHVFRHFFSPRKLKSNHFLNKWIGTLLIMFRSLQFWVFDPLAGFLILDSFPFNVVKPALFPISTKGFFKVTELSIIVWSLEFPRFYRLVLKPQFIPGLTLTYWKNVIHFGKVTKRSRDRMLTVVRGTETPRLNFKRPNNSNTEIRHK